MQDLDGNETVAGIPPFDGRSIPRDPLEAKRLLAQRLPSILPREVVRSDLLINFCRGLIAPDPMKEFLNAEDADLKQEAAVGFHRQLVKGNLAAEYDNEIRLWLKELDGLPQGRPALRPHPSEPVKSSFPVLDAFAILVDPTNQ